MSDTLYPHQESVFKHVTSGKNVILQAPTGAGKTRAALYPFLRAYDPNDDLAGTLPRKCIYSVPMRVLAKQFKHEYTRIVQNYNLNYHLDMASKIQTGEQPEDPLFAGSLIFATIDQTLSSFLVHPYSLSKSKANLNAAAVMGAYLVFDEFHLYDPQSTLPTTLHMLRLLDGITPFVLMTATFSQDMLDNLAELLNAEVVGKSPAEHEQFSELASQNKIRRYQTCDGVLSAQAVLDVHDRRSLVICNTVDRARAIHRQLAARCKESDTQVILLHSRFLGADRNRIEDDLRQRFGKDADKRDGSLIVVSTQAIEVGVDITSTRLHTELAPANAIIQRAGRCARYPGDEGDVYIYRSSHALDGSEVDLFEQVNPYASQQTQFKDTFEQFHARSGDAFQFADEQAILSTVHGARDAEIIDQIRYGSYEHRRRMFGLMRGDDAASVQALVREVFQQRITISANPDVLLDSPFDAPAFGMHPGTLQRHIENWLTRDDVNPPWRIKYLYELPRTAEVSTAEAENRQRYQWLEVRTTKTAWGASLLVVHPALASYDPVLGFLPETGDERTGHWEAELPEKKDRQEGSRFTYRLETYEDHIAQVYEAAFHPTQGVWKEMADTAARLERRFGWHEESLKQAAQAAVLLHDVGKLSRGWQGWVQKYQAAIGKPVEAGKAYAHTDLHDSHHREIEKTMPRRPWHAVEGGVACVPILLNLFGEGHPLAFAVYSAIARHHAAFSFENGAFQLTKNAVQHVQAAVVQYAPEILVSVDLDHALVEAKADPHGDLVVKLNDEPQSIEIGAYLAYCLLVRVLRRADQLGTARSVHD